MVGWCVFVLLGSVSFAVHGIERANHSDSGMRTGVAGVQPPPYHAYEGMDCGQQDATVLPCAQPDEATSKTCQKACDECPNCVATVLVRGGTASPARCDFRACDTSCGCYVWGSGQCNHSRPPADASPAPQYQLFAKTIDPHFCRQWAFDHMGVAGRVVKPPRYYTYDGMDCGHKDATALLCAQPDEATAETCQKACDKCPNCVATVLVKGDAVSSARCEFRACDTSCGCYSTGYSQCNHAQPPADAWSSPQHQLFVKTIDPHFCRQWAYDHMGVAGRVVKPPRYYEYASMTCGSHPHKTKSTGQFHLDMSHAMPCTLLVTMETGYARMKQLADAYADKAQVQELRSSGMLILRFGSRHESCVAAAHELQHEAGVKSVEFDDKVTIAQADQNERAKTGFSCAPPSCATAESCKTACDECSDCVAVVFVEAHNGSSAQCEFRGCDTSCGCYMTTGDPQCSLHGPPSDASALPHHHLFAKTIDPHFCRLWAYSHHGVAGQVAAVNDLWEDHQALATNKTSHKSTWSVWYWALGSSTGLGLIALFHHRVHQEQQQRLLLLDCEE